MQAKEYLTVREVAELFRVSIETVRVWILEGKDGRFPNAIKPGRGYLIPRGDVAKFLNELHGEREL